MFKDNGRGNIQNFHVSIQQSTFNTDFTFVEAHVPFVKKKSEARSRNSEVVTSTFGAVLLNMD